MFASGAARQALLEEPGGLVPHQVGRLDRGVGAGDRELDALVRADRPAEDDALATRTPSPSRRTSARRRCTRPRSARARRSSRRGCSGSRCPSSPTSSSPGTSTPSRKISVVAWFISVRIGRIVIVPSASARFMSTRKVESPSVFFSTWSAGVVRASRSIRSECSRPRRPDLLAADDPAAVDARRRRLERRRVGAGASARSRRRPAAAARPRRSAAGTAAFCSSRAVPQDRAHDVHLRVAGARVAAGRVDLLEDHARRRERRAPRRRTPPGRARRASRRSVSAATNSSG